MAEKPTIKDILRAEEIGATVTVYGWVRTFRNNQFIALSDGTTIKTLQVVVDLDLIDDATRKRITTGAAISATGEIVPSQGRGQTIELKAARLEIVGDADPEKYPLQPKRHSLEFLREIAHLRFRTNTFGAVFRVRHALAFAIHKFFNDRGYVYLHSPIITASDAEGAGEMFQVTTLPLDDIPKTEDGSVDFGQDFFGAPANLSVSGQLEAELAALALTKVYTFGPTFRAENSNTSRHLAEFWMIEPEVAFFNIHDDMDLAEDMLKYIIQYTLDECDDDLAFLESRLIQEEKQKPQHERSEMALRDKLRFCVDQTFERITYTEAINVLQSSKPHKKGKFQFPVDRWGIDLQSEHERYLVEKHYKKPVIITGYPKEIKAFYMRLNEDGKTVAAMDILFPGIGEIVGGSQREERLDYLERRMEEMGIPAEEMQWFLDTRRFGTCPHAGFGLGFGRLVQFVTGMGNIRDVIPFPRTPGKL
ncbi:MAG: asparagine--tRNA ligase, partial [Saprospiraceae bacterium]|nr:asparagine--tRNA ligase [Saprospiraceae bacterium]